MDVRLLSPADADAFRELRLFALLDSPTAFSSSWEEERLWGTDRFARILESNNVQAVFGAFDSAPSSPAGGSPAEPGNLIGITGIYRDSAPKLHHKAVIWGVFVRPEHRKGGMGRALMRAAITHAFAMPGVHHLMLSVNARNEPAMKLYESLGFVAFGLERGYMIVDGGLQDEVHMALSP